MKVKTLATFYMGSPAKPEVVPPGEIIDLPDDEAESNIKAGMAAAVVEEKKAPAETKKGPAKEPVKE